MPYTRKPFNPLAPRPNQVVEELNQANENFDILAQVFLNNDPTTRVLRSDVYTFRQVNMTNATSNYNLQLGEEAYYAWNTMTSTVLPLRIIVSGQLYQMIIIVPNRVAVPINISLLPNNLTYSFAFQRTVIYPDGDNSFVYNHKDNINSILYEQVGGGGVLVSWLQTTIANKGEMHYMTIQHTGLSFSQYIQGAHRWNNTTTVWSLLGTLTISRANGIVYVSVRRLL